MALHHHKRRCSNNAGWRNLGTIADRSQANFGLLNGECLGNADASARSQHKTRNEGSGGILAGSFSLQRRVVLGRWYH